MYFPPMILPGDAGPVNALGYCDMLGSSQASLVECPSQDAGSVAQHRPPRHMIWTTTHWISGYAIIDTMPKRKIQVHNHPPLVSLRLGDQANMTSVK